MTGHGFEGRVAIVTGAAGIIGSETAALLAGRGANVVVADLDVDRLVPVADRCGQVGSAPFAVAVDQASSDSVDAMVAATLERFGRLDILCNIAGIWDFFPVEQTTDEWWDRTLRVNLTGTFYCCRSALPALRAEGGGAIVNTSSGTAFRAVKTVGAYAASKGGIVAFSRVLAEEAAPEVRVNVITPGLVESPGQDAAAAGSADAEQVRQSAAEGIPLGRRVRPLDVAKAIAFLVSSEAEFVTGTVMHVNGGRFMP